MPKERRHFDYSREQYQHAASSSSSQECQTSSLWTLKRPLTSKSTAEDMKEWDEVHCPICVEHPHNAILLICTSHDKVRAAGLSCATPMRSLRSMQKESIRMYGLQR